jgi:glycopeptide antibiotics resistance protein
MAFGIVLGSVLGLLLGPHMRIARWRLALWLVAMLSVPAATWTVPSHAARFEPTFRMCTEGQFPRPSMLYSGFTTEVASNILMTLPIGAAAVLWPVGARRLAALCVALATPPVIETVQLIPALRRGCQVGDVVNNSIGVLVGFAIAAGLETAVVSWRRAHRPTGRDDPQVAGSSPAP